MKQDESLVNSFQTYRAKGSFSKAKIYDRIPVYENMFFYL